LIDNRRTAKLLDLDKKEVLAANLAELRVLALQNARPFVVGKERATIYRERSRPVHYYVLSRASGCCEACKAVAPFFTPDGDPYLEPHHTKRLADDGPDHPATVIALCPNCHRRAHSAKDRIVFNQSLIKKLVRLEGRIE
jgi:5-methylcytosine-specific restriction protein A